MIEGNVTSALANAERVGIRLMLIGRSIVLAAAGCWFAYGFYLTGNPSGLVLVGASLALGLAVLKTLGTEAERRWHRYGIVAIDATLAAAAAIFLPLLSAGEVPRILVFRAYGIHFLWVMLAVSALALSPRLILFTGAALIAVVWTVFAVAVSQLENPRSWGDLPADTTPQDYINLLLDIDFIGTGNRFEETGALLLATGVLAFAVKRARDLTIAYAIEEDKRLRAERVFGRYVPQPVVQRILDSPDALGATVQQGSVLFVDVEGFTRFAEGKPPDEVLADLGSFVARVSDIVAAYDGVAIGFGGDSVLATFGVPIASANHAEKALAAAKAILAEERRGKNGAHFKARAGIATGPIAAGAVGSAARQTYTVYGETVNLAQRLEAANKDHGTRLMVSAVTAAACKGNGLTEYGPLALRGFSEPVVAWGR
jgi:class 3 adenylate cyclase